MADAASIVAGAPTAGGPASGTTGFSFADAVSGGFLDAVSIGLADASLPAVARPFTSDAIASDLPDLANLSASSRFLGACLAIAARTAATNAALSKVPAGAAAMSPALAVLACASLSSAGALAAFPAAAARFPAGGWAAARVRAAPTCCFAARKPG
ncbi:MAG: hypothetical protein QM711_06875 [Micropruina sp.]|uniref:hypothetical protein n=1 Tax=Micropruina sp. TaxID=2737536 RepID=UPI0039E3CE05